MILDRKSLLLWPLLQPLQRRAARARVSRWAAAATRERRLATDLVEMGGVLARAPIDQAQRLQAGPEQLAYDQGRRDLAVELLSMMSIGQDELLNLMEDNDDA